MTRLHPPPLPTFELCVNPKKHPGSANPWDKTSYVVFWSAYSAPLAKALAGQLDGGCFKTAFLDNSEASACHNAAFFGG